MLHIAQKNIYLEKSELLRRYDFTDENLREDFEVTGGEWKTLDGRLDALYERDGGALIYSKRRFDGDVILDFEAEAVPPCVNDVNFTWKAEGWDYGKSDALRGYVAGLGGWWDGKTGMEKYPTCRPWAATPLFKVESGRRYHITAGSIGEHCFIAVDGQVIIEMFDPSPETLDGAGRVGLGVYASHARFGPLSVYRPNWESAAQSYN